MRDSGFGSFLAGLVIGGLVGAAVGLLLTPQSGDEARERIGGFVDEKRAQLGEAINEGRDAAAQARAEMESQAGGWAPEGTGA
jgi:gas vesicle protein